MFLGLTAADAHAGYICGLTESKISSVLSYYNSSITLNKAKDTMTAPFECSNFGGLCSEVGQDRAEDFVCARWAEAVAHQSTATIAANGDADLEQLGLEWEAERWPFGIPDDSPYWGLELGPTDPPPTTCETVVTRYNAGRTVKVRGKSFWVLTIAYNSIGVSTKRWYLKANGAWDRDGTVVSSGTASKPSEGCSTGLYDSDTDGWVADSVKGIFFFPYKEVDGSHTGTSVPTFSTCNTAGWAGDCL
jgi:hypothetical protein